MRAGCATAQVFGLVAGMAAMPSHANRLTIEVWQDASPDHTISCSLSLRDGWISLVRVRGAGMPGPAPMRWPASRDEVEALSHGLQALVSGSLTSVDPYTARQPPAPFFSVTWMTRLDDSLASGLYLQPGLRLPKPLATTLSLLGIDQPCGLNARSGG